MAVREQKLLGFFCMALLLTAGACTHPISKQLRRQAGKDAVPFTAALADPAAGKGRIVLWGGKVVETTNIPNGTEIVVLETPLDFLGVPDAARASRGRFLARSTQFLDPAIYAPDRDITIAGEIAGAEERPLGQTTYSYPVILVKELHLWEKLDTTAPGTGWGGPFWGPYYWHGPYY